MYLSRAFDRLLPNEYLIDGHGHFRYVLAPKYIKAGLKIYDIGGGKVPYISLSMKKELDLIIIGLDIDSQELDHAPENAYDQAIVADITEFRGNGDAELVICQAVLEHVKNVDKAFEGIASILKPGGKALIFVPSRNSLYVRLNLFLPETIKRKLLFSIYHPSREFQGFISYYDRCTPKDFRLLANKHKFKVIEEQAYYTSGYLAFFFPLYFLWRLWVIGFHLICGDQSAETFSFALEKEGHLGSEQVKCYT